MFGHNPSDENSTEVTTAQALEIAELLERYFINLPAADLMAAAQVNKQWSAQVNVIIGRTDIIQLDDVADKKLWLQLTSVAPTLVALIQRATRDPNELTALAKQFIDSTREIANKLKISNGAVIKHFAMIDRCSQFSQIEMLEFAALMRLPVMLARIYNPDFQSASRFVNFILASNISFPLVVISSDVPLMDKFKKLSNDHQLSFMDTYMILTARLISNNSAQGADSPAKDCETALNFLIENPEKWREGLNDFKKSMQADGFGDDICAAISKMDSKVFDSLLAHTILSRLRGEANGADNKQLVTELAESAKSKQENILVTLRTVADLIRNNPGISNSDILASLNTTSKPSPR